MLEIKRKRKTHWRERKKVNMVVKRKEASKMRGRKRQDRNEIEERKKQQIYQGKYKTEK